MKDPEPIIDKELMRQFGNETDRVAMYRRDGADYHTLRYVQWLEAKVRDSKKTCDNPECNNGVVWIDGGIIGVNDVPCPECRGQSG